jgi:CRP-like cAMP-binding protein
MAFITKVRHLILEKPRWVCRTLSTGKFACYKGGNSHLGCGQPPELAELMKFLLHDPKSHDELKLVPKGVFENIQEDELEQLRQAGEWAWASEKDVILEPEQKQPFLYVVIRGSVRVYKTHFRSGKEHALADLYEGECFGEMAFLGEGKATAGVKARERSLLWRLSHENLMEYLTEYKGAGQMCLNLSAILAHRLKEGNSRLNGLAGGLSAYFGLDYKIHNDVVDVPSTGDPAEFEIPASVMDSFVRETLRMDQEEVVSQEAVELVQEMLEEGKVDLISWLDAGSAGHRLKLKVKLAEVDSEGNELEDVEYDSAFCTVEVTSADLAKAREQGSSTPRAGKAAAKTARSLEKSKTGAPAKSSLANNADQKGILGKPTKSSATRATQKQPRPIPVLEEEPSLLKKLIFPAACLFLAWLIVMIVILVIPGPTKAGWVTGEEGEVNEFTRGLLFPTSKLPFGQSTKKWKAPFEWDLSKYATEKAWMILNFETKKPLEKDLTVKVYLQGPESTDNILTGSKSYKVLKLKNGEGNWLIQDFYLQPGSGEDYRLDFEIMDRAHPANEWEEDDAKMKVKVFR